LFVPLDDSPLSESVLPTVIDLANQMGLPVVLVQVVPLRAQMYGGFETYAYDPRLDQELEAAAVKYMKTAVERLTSSGVRTTYEVVRGYPANQIIDAAEKTSGGMIVMATHGRSGMGRWVLGSVADRVVRASPLPVLLLRATAP
jgi:nucleotide-binding universal stress UspA family protein